MKKLWTLIHSMLKVGVIGFGGGNALIPVIEQEAVKEKKMVNKEEYDKDIVAATLTPGALPVELASGIGYQYCGKRGMLAGGVAMALPGALLTVLMLSVLKQLDDVLLTQIQYASIGITAFIMCLLTEYIVDTVKKYNHSSKRVILWCVIAGVFILSAGKNLLGIFRIDRTPIFGVSTVDVLLVAFFAILYTGCEFNWKNVSVTVLVGGVYLLCVGKAGVISNEYVTWTARILMVVLSVYGVVRGGTKKKKNVKTDLRPLAVKTVIWILFFILLSLPAFLFVSHHALHFSLKGLISSLLSFGGGDAYLTIADGLFVPDYIGDNEFYNHLVLIVNILPGSILCKTLTGIGYEFGVNISGSGFGGVLMALAGFSCSVAASCGVFNCIFHLYEWMEKITIFAKIKKSIRVIVSGLLLTVMAGLVKSGMATNTNPELPHYTVLVMILAIYGLNMILKHKTKGSNLLLIGVSLVLSVGLCNLIGV